MQLKPLWSDLLALEECSASTDSFTHTTSDAGGEAGVDDGAARAAQGAHNGGGGDDVLQPSLQPVSRAPSSRRASALHAHAHHDGAHPGHSHLASMHHHHHVGARFADPHPEGSAQHQDGAQEPSHSVRAGPRSARAMTITDQRRREIMDSVVS